MLSFYSKQWLSNDDEYYESTIREFVGTVEEYFELTKKMIEESKVLQGVEVISKKAQSITIKTWHKGLQKDFFISVELITNP